MKQISRLNAPGTSQTELNAFNDARVTKVGTFTPSGEISLPESSAFTALVNNSFSGYLFTLESVEPSQLC